MTSPELASERPTEFARQESTELHLRRRALGLRLAQSRARKNSRRELVRLPGLARASTWPPGRERA